MQEVSSPSREALEGELGWEGVPVPPYCQHSLQSKGPGNQVNPIFIHLFFIFTDLFTHLFVCSSCMGQGQRTMVSCGFPLARWPTSFYGDSPFSTFPLPREDSRCIPCPALYGHWDPGAAPDACFTHGASLLAYGGHLHLYSVCLLVGS